MYRTVTCAQMCICFSGHCCALDALYFKQMHKHYYFVHAFRYLSDASRTVYFSLLVQRYNALVSPGDMAQLMGLMRRLEAAGQLGLPMGVAAGAGHSNNASGAAFINSGRSSRSGSGISIHAMAQQKSPNLIQLMAMIEGAFAAREASAAAGQHQT